MNRALLFMAFFVSVTLSLSAQGSLIEWLPIESETLFRTKNPIGWTDGVTQRLSFGVESESAHIQLRLSPTLVISRADRRANIFISGLTGSQIRTVVRADINRIDAPATFSDSQTRLIPGNSSLSVQAFGQRLKLSTESIKWGPGIRHGLILSGSYEGFPHLEFETAKPLNLYFGAIEGSLISGRLSNSGQNVKIPQEGLSALIPKLDKWRYLSGFDVSVSLALIPELKFGLSRTFTGYHSILDDWSDYFPMFQPLTKDNFQDEINPSGDDEWDQQISIYFDWSFPNEGFRLWGEFGRNDHSADLRDLIVEPDHSRAYVVGGQKNFMAWSAVVEITQLAMTKTQELRPSPIWYTHHIVRHGVTHLGQLLGPNIGPGSHSVWVGLQRQFQDNRQIGIEFERVQRSEDLYVRLFPDNTDRRWSDINVTTKFSDNWLGSTVTTSLTITKSRNYAFKQGYDPVDGSIRFTIIMPLSTKKPE